MGTWCPIRAKSCNVRNSRLYARSGDHIKQARSSELNSLRFAVQIHVADGQFHGILRFSDFRRLVQDLGTFRAIFLCFGCAARIVGAGHGASILIPHDS